MKFKVWVDADACPKAIKEIIFNSSGTTLILVILPPNLVIRLDNHFEFVFNIFPFINSLPVKINSKMVLFKFIPSN